VERPYVVRVLGRQRGHQGDRAPAQGYHGLDIGLDPGTASRIVAAYAEDARSWLHLTHDSTSPARPPAAQPLWPRGPLGADIWQNTAPDGREGGSSEVGDSMKQYMCVICGYIYDEAKGVPDEGLPPGTRWEDVPLNWKCPECGAGKEDFEMIEI
jgi:rubredoxin